jgi:hypothetical protein
MNIPNKKLLDSYLQDNNVFCPFCGSQDITFISHIEEFPGIVTGQNHCETCDMTWFDEFKIQAISWLNDNGDLVYSDEFDFEHYRPVKKVNNYRVVAELLEPTELIMP